MCRFLAYTGEPILPDELLYRPKNSLILQSHKAKEREEPLNGDGFGIGWYTPELGPTPGIFRSITPAWSNINLQNLSQKLRAGVFFAHVRAATHNTPVLEVNCHPFSYGRLLWMHNGQIGGFPIVKRKLINLLSEERYQMILGTTDTEHAFALFLDYLANPAGSPTLFEMKVALLQMIDAILRLTTDNRVEETSYLNICVSNGDGLIALRFISDPHKQPHTLYFSQEGKYTLVNGMPQLVDTVSTEHGVIVSSERLTEREKDWNPIPPNHFAMIDRTLSVQEEPVQL
ncbi:MAG: class II glutamine amidotransferase [Bacteroidota bacterium]